MERMAWRARIKSGSKDEYKRRHDEIWPEMEQALKDAGIVNYTIWWVDDEIFGYYECTKGREYARNFQKDSPVCQRWRQMNGDILIAEPGPLPPLECLFILE